MISKTVRYILSKRVALPLVAVAAALTAFILSLALKPAQPEAGQIQQASAMASSGFPEPVLPGLPGYGPLEILEDRKSVV